MATKKQTIAPEFTRTLEFIGKYHAIGTDDPAALRVSAIWAMGTWTFSDSSPAAPATYPYIYYTGARGSGKSVLGREVIGAICRRPEKIVQATGPALFRMIGDFDEETGEIIATFPTLLIDEVDATFSGAANESLRGTLNEGYKRGATVPRAWGKTTLRYPCYCAKLLMGIDNGHLPDTVTDRSIRIDLVKHTQDELTRLGIQPMFSWDVEDEVADLSQALADWAKRNAMVLRDYRPDPMPGLTGRQWEISRSLVQLARAAGIEDRIRADLLTLFARQPEKVDARVELYTAIFEVFEDNDTTKITTRMILAHLREKGIVGVATQSGKGLASVLSGDGIQPTYLRIDKPDHPGYVEGKTTHRGYHRYQFDDVFVNFLSDDDDDDDC